MLSSRFVTEDFFPPTMPPRSSRGLDRDLYELNFPHSGRVRPCLILAHLPSPTDSSPHQPGSLPTPASLARPIPTPFAIPPLPKQISGSLPTDSGPSHYPAPSLPIPMGPSRPQPIPLSPRPSVVPVPAESSPASASSGGATGGRARYGGSYGVGVEPAFVSLSRARGNSFGTGGSGIQRANVGFWIYLSP